MLEQQLLHAVPGLQLLDLTLADQCLVFHLASITSAAACPLCGHQSERVHSLYSRQPADLPWADCVVHYILQVRRFFCDNLDCGRRIFAERFGLALRSYARRTTQLASRLQQLGLAAGGAVGAALATFFAMPTSPSTLLRLIRAAELPSLPTPRVLSIDDFAFRKGQTYGTILVDLESHCPVDLLPDREPETVAAWLRDHPGVEIISRDRASAYAQAATDGAPAAVQVADRFHLIGNLGDALKRLLDHHPDAMRAVTEQLAQLAAAALSSPSDCSPPLQPPLQPPPQLDTALPSPSSVAMTAMTAMTVAVNPSCVASTTQRRFAAIKELQEQGCGQREIARRLGLHRRTVQRYMLLEAPPQRAHGRQSQSQARAYIPYLRQRWADGNHSAVMLWKELQQQGYTGSYSSIYRLLIRRIGKPTGAGPGGGSGSGSVSGSGFGNGSSMSASLGDGAEVRPLTASQAKWLLLRQLGKLTTQEEQQRTLLCAICPVVATAYELTQRFTALIRERKPEGLDEWISDAKASGVVELRNFALGVQRDYQAVLGAMSSPWSQGQTEGQVNRLKLIKRSCFGRAKFDLLRLRVLHQPKHEARRPFHRN